MSNRTVLVVDGDNLKGFLIEQKLRMNFRLFRKMLRERYHAQFVGSPFFLSARFPLAPANARMLEAISTGGFQAKLRRIDRFGGYGDIQVKTWIRKRIDAFDTLILVSEDRDFLDVIEEVSAAGKRVIVVYYSASGSSCHYGPRRGPAEMLSMYELIAENDQLVLLKRERTAEGD